MEATELASVIEPTTKHDANVIRLPQVARQRTLAIIKEVKVNVDQRIMHLFDGLAANVADALFEEMWELDEQQALEHHFNVMRALKMQSPEYRAEFSRLLSELWLIFLNRRGEPVLVQPRGIAETVINSFRSRTESHYKVIINDIRARLSGLLRREIDDYPLCPEMLYFCFWQAISKLELRYDERVMLIPLFHRFVMDRYGQVLAIANQTLIEHSVSAEPFVAKVKKV